MDWRAWHTQYDQPDSRLSRRLGTVQRRIAIALDEAPPGPVRVVSLCAGEGRDLLPVLAAHPRRDDVTARLIELDAELAAAAKRSADAAGLSRVEVVTGDASLTDRYVDAVPADLVLICGVFGNITDADIERVIGYCAQLCAAGATVIWTRHRDEPDLIPRVCQWFAERDFALEWVSHPSVGYGVGVHLFIGEPRPIEPGQRMFSFVGRASLPTTG